MGNRARVVDQVRYRKSGRVKVNEPVERPVLSEDAARTMTSILENVV